MPRRIRRLIPSIVAVAVVGLLVTMPVASAASTYRVQLDAKPPTHEPWTFLRFFPKAITVHQGDVIDAAWAGVGAPHTATLVPADDAEAWRATYQGPPGPQDPATYPYAVQTLDTFVGGDDGDVILNPSVAAPSDPTCGGATAPCVFDGTGVVSSGFLSSNQVAEPSFDVQMDAPVGTYSFVCLVHPGMQETVHVVAPDATIPSPDDVAAKTAKQVRHAKRVYGEQADEQAQTVTEEALPHGHTRYSIWAGGFSHNVSADEFVDRGLTVNVGDKVRVNGNLEIHTATVPFSSVNKVPFIVTQCEQPGADAPATDPSSCADPTDFQVVFNAKALAPTSSNQLTRPSRFVNSGLLGFTQAYTFVAKAPGTYTFVCLVHGPSMTTRVTVR
jgi:plastocyanin